MMGAGLKQLKMDTCVYTQVTESRNIITVYIYVDDQAIAGPDKRVASEFKREMGHHF